MAPILLIECKTKPFSSILMIAFGLGLISFGGWFINSTGVWWWLIAVLFGVFCLYHWVKILINGSMTLVLFADNGNLYVTYDHTKKIMTRLDEIKNLEHYTKLFHLDKIERFWRYIVKTNGTVSSDVLYFMYNNEQQELADLDYYGADIKEEDMTKVLYFLLEHNPHIQIGKD